MVASSHELNAVGRASTEGGPAVDLWSLLDGLPVPVVVNEIGPAETTLFVNRRFTLEYGYVLEDMPTVSASFELGFPDPAYRRQVLDRFRTEISERIETGLIHAPAEFRMTSKSGRVHDVLIGFALIDNLAVVSLQDITEKRRAEVVLEQERRQTAEAAYSLTENMPAGAYTMVLRPGAAMAEFGFVSQQFLKILGLRREDVLSDPMKAFACVHPDDHEDWIKLNAHTFAKKAPFSAETRVIVNGEVRWIRAESVPRELDDGSVLWEGLLVDIHLLKRTEARLNAVLEAAHAYTWTLDLETRQINFDEGWFAANGYGPEPAHMFLGDWKAAIHPDDVGGIWAAFESLRDGRSDRQVALYRRRHRDGHWLWMQVHAGVSARDSDGKATALSGVSFDMTGEMEERQRGVEDQAQLREDLQRAQQRDTVAQVAGGVAHDLNNLVAVIAGTVEVLEAQAKDHPWLAEGIGRIRRSVRVARDLIAGLGGLVRPDLDRGSHDLGKLLRDAIDLLGQRRIARNSIQLLLSGTEGAVWANPTEIAQVVVNIAINACDSGSPDHPAKVWVVALPVGAELPDRPPDAGVAPAPGIPMALFAVTDNGLGMDDTVRARMFRPNFTTKGKAGTGLGLPIVSNILGSNRAALWVDSAPGAGTTITIAWPSVAPRQIVRPDARSEVSAQVEPPPAATGLLKDLRVLVVDDLPDVADVLADMLEAAGAVTVAVSDPLEAAKALSEAPEVWSVMVTDLHMEGMDGRELARHAGSLAQPVPVVLVTARRDVLGSAPAREFASVLSKPVTGTQLARAVRRAFDRRAGHPVG